MLFSFATLRFLGLGAFLPIKKPSKRLVAWCLLAGVGAGFSHSRASHAEPSLALAATTEEPEPARWTYWAGHQTVLGTRKIPFLGTIDTRLDAFYLAKIRHNGESLEIIEETCRSLYAPIAGIHVTFPAQALPAIRIRLVADAQGTYRGQTLVKWDHEDLDADGWPGLSIDVDAALCGGKIYVGSQTRVNLRLTTVEAKHIHGEIELNHTFKVHDASTFCLRTFSRNRSESARGNVTFIPLEAPQTCEHLLRRPWPSVAPSIH